MNQQDPVKAVNIGVVAGSEEDPFTENPDTNTVEEEYEVLGDRPFVRFQFIPETTPVSKFTKRAAVFVSQLTREQCEIVGSLCIIMRGEMSTPEELQHAASLTGRKGQGTEGNYVVGVTNNAPITREDTDRD